MKRYVIAFVLALMQLAAAAQNALPDSVVRFIQKTGDSLYRAEKLPGLFVGVLNGGRRQYFNLGYAVPEKRLPFDSATVFEAGSITKTFTAYVLESVLREKGIRDTVSILPFLPDSVQGNKALASVTFLSLLNHTSGLPRLPTNMQPADPQKPYDDYTTAHLFSYLKTAAPEPDGKSNYSNLGAGLAGVLAGRIARNDFKNLVEDSILTAFAVRLSDDHALYRRSQGHFGDGRPVAFWEMASLYPAGGLHCTAEEMLNYLRYISQPSNLYRKAIIHDLLQPTARLSPAVQVAKAWHTLERPGKPTIYWHNGGTFGFSTFAAFVRDSGQAVVVVVNQSGKNNVSDGLGIGIMRRLAQ